MFSTNDKSFPHIFMIIRPFHSGFRTIRVVARLFYLGTIHQIFFSTLFHKIKQLIGRTGKIMFIYTISTISVGIIGIPALLMAVKITIEIFRFLFKNTLLLRRTRTTAAATIAAKRISVRLRSSPASANRRLAPNSQRTACRTHRS